jgi:hypothetical protein
MGDRTHHRAAYEPVPHWNDVPISRSSGAAINVTGKDDGSDAKRVQTHPPGSLLVRDVTAPGELSHLQL